MGTVPCSSPCPQRLASCGLTERAQKVHGEWTGLSRPVLALHRGDRPLNPLRHQIERVSVKDLTNPKARSRLPPQCPSLVSRGLFSGRADGIIGRGGSEPCLLPHKGPPYVHTADTEPQASMFIVQPTVSCLLSTGPLARPVCLTARLCGNTEQHRRRDGRVSSSSVDRSCHYMNFIERVN